MKNIIDRYTCIYICYKIGDIYLLFLSECYCIQCQSEWLSRVSAFRSGSGGVSAQLDHTF